MERYGYNGGCGVSKHTRIEVFKRKLAWATDKWLRLIINIMLFKTSIPLRI